MQQAGAILVELPEWEKLQLAWSELHPRIGCPNCDNEYCPACDQVYENMENALSVIATIRVLGSGISASQAAVDDGSKKKERPMKQNQLVGGKETKSLELLERFNSRYTPEPYSGCWLWTGGVSGLGYGSIRKDGKNKRAHRVSWEIHNGVIPDKADVLHRCDTPSCVNPKHLFLGDDRANVLDAIAKGRWYFPDNRGERNGTAILTAEQVIEIRASKESALALSRKFKVHLDTIKCVWLRKTWKHIR